MITRIKELPDNMVVFSHRRSFSKRFYRRSNARSRKIYRKKDKLNYMLVIETDLSKFTAGAWFQDAMLGRKNINQME